MNVRTKKLMVLLTVLLLPLWMPNINIAYAWYNTQVQTTTFYVYDDPEGKMGTTTQYGFIGPSGDRQPQFYSALIASGTPIPGFSVYPEEVKIEVSGTDPSGNPLLGDRFGGLSVLSSPDESQVEQTILSIIFDALLNVVPYGLLDGLKYTITAGGATTGWASEKAWGEWRRPTFSWPVNEKGLRFGYYLVVDPALEGTYTINIHYHTWLWADTEAGQIAWGEMDLYDTVTYTYVNTPNTPSTPSGPTSGYTYATYTYSTSTTDPNGDSLRYEFSWSDGTTTLTGWYASGVTASASHYWVSAGTKNVKVRAQDSTGAWSGWSIILPVYISPTLTISASLSGTTDPAPGTYTYAYGSSVTVTAYSDYTFIAWYLDGTIKYENPITVTMNSDHTLKAYFKGKFPPWDVNDDGKCNIEDIAIAAKAYGSKPGDPNWDPRADITGPTYLVPDGKVDIRDIALVAKHFGETYD